MAANNVFQMLAQQEIDRPARRLRDLQIQQQEMQIKQGMADQAYQQQAQTDLAAMPQSTQTTQTLGSMAPQGQSFNPVAGPQQSSMDPNAQGGSLAALGVNPMQQTETKPVNFAQQFDQVYQYHKNNGREAEAKAVLDQQMEFTAKAAKLADGVFKTYGIDGLKEWHRQNPKWGSLLGDPSTIKTDGQMVKRPMSNPDGTPSTTDFFSVDAQGKTHFFKDAPEKPEKPEYKFREYEKGDRKVSEESQDGGRTWKPVSSAPRYKPVATGTDGGGDDINAWAKAVMDGRANLQDVPSRGTIRSQVVKLIEQKGGTDYAANRADNAAFGSSITQQQKQVGAMGSFVKNMDAQIAQVRNLSKDLRTFDSRLLNLPLRAVRGRIAGSPLQSKYDMYLTEIESEIGKLATGSSGSVAELSIGAQEKWAKIHDKNLSVKDMLSLLEETSHAGKLRMKSVKDQLEETRKEQRNRGKKPDAKSDPLGIL